MFSGPVLERFFIFSPPLGPTDETEQEKLLFFQPDTLSEQQQLKHVGLSEGLIHFANAFQPADPCSIVRTLRGVQCFLECEPDFWMVMVLEHPHTLVPSKRVPAAAAAAAAGGDRSLHSSAAASAPSTLSSTTLSSSSLSTASSSSLLTAGAASSFSPPAGASSRALSPPPTASPQCAAARVAATRGTHVALFDDSFLDESVLRALLGNIYRFFRFFNGPMAQLVERRGVSALRTTLEIFIPSLLRRISFANADIFDALDGIRFIPVARDAFLHATHSVFRVENTCPQVLHSALLYDEHLVWSGLSQPDMRVLYKYLIFHVLHGDSSARPATCRGFLRGPENLDDPHCAVNSPVVYLQNREECNLVVFQHEQLLVALLVDPMAISDFSFFRALHNSLLQQMTPILRTLTDNYIRAAGNEDSYKYIYFNHMNLAYKSSLGLPRNGVSLETMQVLEYMHGNFQKNKKIKEFCVKTKRQGWVIGQLVAQREFYVIFETKGYNMSEISEQVRSLARIFFHQSLVD